MEDLELMFGQDEIDLLTKEILKIHDQLIPYEDLTEEEKYKDLNLFLLLPLIHKLRSSLNKF